MRDSWTEELNAAGWKEVRMFVWKSPWGALYRGPAHAWKVMESVKQWGLKQCADCGEVASEGGKVAHKKECARGDLAVKVLEHGLLV